ncbi:MAG TPA: DUF397 domain-containing protein [Trebonia sp.]|nr:DUF397 domain-containing protein [Trebonia sp.]
MTWRKSSYSSNGGGSCVEVGGAAGRVLVRDTKDPERRATVSVPAGAWAAFTAGLRKLRTARAPGLQLPCRGRAFACCCQGQLRVGPGRQVRWILIVLSDRCSPEAISRLDWPRASSRNTDDRAGTGPRVLEGVGERLLYQPVDGQPGWRTAGPVRGVGEPVLQRQRP